jgi:signal transduction histidine kinase
VRTALFRIYQEALNNFIKHAKSDEVYVRLEVGEEIAQLEVMDKGAGFEVPKDWLTMARKGHLGLVGIQERVDAVGGKMEIASHPGQGTQLVVYSTLFVGCVSTVSVERRGQSHGSL